MKRFDYSPGWLLWFILSFAWVIVIFVRSIFDAEAYYRRLGLLRAVMGNGKK